MVRPHALGLYFWIILWVALALLLLIAEAALLPQPVMTIANQIKETLSLFIFQATRFIR